MGGDFSNPYYIMDDKAHLAATPMSDRQMMVVRAAHVGDEHRPNRDVAVSPTLDAGARNGPMRNQGGVVVYNVYPEAGNQLRARDLGDGPAESVVTRVSSRPDRGTIIVNPPADPEWVRRMKATLFLRLTTQRVAAVFRKSRRAQSTEDEETWVPDIKANTLNVFDVGDTRATVAVVEGYYESGPGFVNATPVAGTLALRDFKGPTTVVREGMYVRRLTPNECQILQGFPPDWNAEGISEDGKPVELSDTQRYKQAGNAVTVNTARWIADRLRPVIEEG